MLSVKDFLCLSSNIGKLSISKIMLKLVKVWSIPEMRTLLGSKECEDCFPTYVKVLALRLEINLLKYGLNKDRTIGAPIFVATNFKTTGAKAISCLSFSQGSLTGVSGANVFS